VNLRFEIEHICSLFGIFLDPDKGQHFLLSKRILRKEVNVANVTKNDIVLDIGAGLGYLTEEIAKRAGKVYAIEIDDKIAKAFEWRLKDMIGEGKIVLIKGDALKVQFPKDVTAVISNPPYHIISPLIIRILRELFSLKNFRVAVMILQQEYVRKLFAKPGSKQWGRLPAAFRYFAKGKIIMQIPKKYFFPQPDVNSTLVRMWPVKMDHLVDFNTYEKATMFLFSFPNRKIRSVLKNILKQKLSEWRNTLTEISKHINIEKRIRQLTVEEIERIAYILKNSTIL